MQESSFDILWEANRVASFTKWVFSDDQNCNVARLAEAGFYFTGSKTEPDSVQCFLCGKSLDGWEAEDDPWSEHLKHSPNCKFAKLQQPESALTIMQFLDIVEQFLNTSVEKSIEQLTRKKLDLFNEFLNLKIVKL